MKLSQQPRIALQSCRLLKTLKLEQNAAVKSARASGGSTASGEASHFGGGTPAFVAEAEHIRPQMAEKAQTIFRGGSKDVRECSASSLSRQSTSPFDHRKATVCLHMVVLTCSMTLSSTALPSP